MTAFLLASLAVVLAFCVYVAAQAARHSSGALLPQVPGWATAFAATGVALSSLGLADHLALVAASGLQASHLALGLVLVALTAALVQKRLRLAATITGIATAGSLLGAYYGSVTLRVMLLALLGLFAVATSAVALAAAGRIVADATGGAAAPGTAIFALALFLFLAAVIGGWRGTIFAVAGLSFLVVLLLALFGGIALVGGVAPAIRAAPGMLADMIPGVVAFSAGIGREAAPGGPFTALAILSAALAGVGVVLSPAFMLLGTTAAPSRAFAVAQVWLIAGLLTGLLLAATPLIASEAARAGGIASFIAGLGRIDGLLGAAFATMLVASLLATVAFFAGAAAPIATRDFFARDLLPGLSPQDERFAARLVLAGTVLAAAFAAAFAPLAAALAATLSIPLAVQLLPAVLGLLWLPWISRGAVHAGLVIGIVLVVFTEPPGIILFDALGVPLPWGRWPLTVHSAAWGLAGNFAACLLVSLATRDPGERLHRARLHEALRRADPDGSGWGGATWALTLVWTFFALGPGAILGNTFFSLPLFSEGEAALGLSSLLVWQAVAWLAGVLIVWWVAYAKRMSLIAPVAVRPLDLGADAGPLDRRPPVWLALFVDRVARRPRAER